MEDESNTNKVNSLLNSANINREVSDYINEYYTRLKDNYKTKTYTTQDGTITANVEVYGNRKIDLDELDAAIILASKGNKVTMLKETGKKQGEKRLDLLLNDSVLVELKCVRSSKSRNIADEVIAAINKGKENIPCILYLADSKNVNYQDVIDSLNLHDKNDFKFENKDILFIKDNKISVIEKNGAGVYSTYGHYIQPRPNQNINQVSDNVNQNNSNIQFQEEENIQDVINQSMTMERAKEMIQRTFILGNIQDWYDGEYKNGDEWLAARGSDEVAMYADNEYQIQDKYLNNIQGMIDGDFLQ